VDNQNIEHKGIVKSIEKNRIVVCIDTMSACSACHANSICSAFNTTQKEIEIYNFNNNYKIGESVKVYFKAKYGFKAVFFGYIFPFFVLIFSLIISFSITEKEGFSGLISILSVALYYVVLYFFKNKLKKTFSFSIEKLQ
jgi:positive regulator of sigma E activity